LGWAVWACLSFTTKVVTSKNIPGTKRRKCLEENIAAADIILTSKELGKIAAVAPKDVAAGDHYADISQVNR
jgi:aryl-alcohol dehydrogenase-like predicted oxidoreductase